MIFACLGIAEVEGVGPLIATAVVAAIADGRMFRNGRQFAAWLGLDICSQFYSEPPFMRVLQTGPIPYMTPENSPSHN